MADGPVTEQALEAVIDGCRAEAQGRPGCLGGCCFELFRRAVDGRDALAWQAVEAQYIGLFRKWLRAHVEVADLDVLSRDALDKAWRVLTAPPTPLGARFPSLGSLLRYLQQCAMTIALDHQRTRRRVQLLHDKLAAAEAAAPEVNAHESALDALCRAERRQAISRWVETHITDPAELRVLALSFEQDLTPAEIVARFPDEFPDVQAVNRIKERILKRARRNLTEM